MSSELIFSDTVHQFLQVLTLSLKSKQILSQKNIRSKTRPSSDSEAATMYKLKGQSSNMRTGQRFENRELVRLADPSSLSV